MNHSNNTALKFVGVLMVIFAIIYAAVGTLALAGMLKGVLPGHESQEILVIVLAYVVALCALLCGVVCVKGALGAAKLFGAIFAVAGLASLVYLQLSHSQFSIMDCLALCFGVTIIFLASKSA